jgi:Ca2+/Na+ antiporter
MPVWLVFLLSALVVAAAGVRLARDGDDIAQASGLGGLWVGAILVAAATSLGRGAGQPRCGSRSSDSRSRPS